jgi:hypothetical protein
MRRRGIEVSATVLVRAAWIAEGPHIMVLLPDPAQLDALPTDPNPGGPYVMWKGTPYAHIMVPVGERPAAAR